MSRTNRIKEKRAFARSPVALAAKLLLKDDAQPLAIRVADISRQGIAVIAEHALPIEGSCALSLDIPFLSGDKRVNAWCEIIYSIPLASQHYRCGLKFADMDAYSRVLLGELSS